MLPKYVEDLLIEEEKTDANERGCCIMSKLLVIGCGGVAAVAIHKCCENSGVFSELCIASRTKSKCDALKEKLEKNDVRQADHRAGGRRRRRSSSSR